jgi:hypothetical protein
MMKPLEYDLVQLCDRYDQGGSYARRSDRKRDLRLMAKQLDKMGFKTMRARDLGGRHVNRLVALWAEQGLSVGTMKNRMGSLRWWAATLGRAHVMARRNETYGIPSRPIPNASRAVELTDDLLQAIDGPFCERIRVSLQLQRYLGLRMEESLKIRPAHAIVRDENGVIVRLDLRGSWCKSGRTRSILIDDDRQRDILEEAGRLAGIGSMIPGALSYIQYLKKMQYRCDKVGLTHRHGLRHRYAQMRYLELTGSLPPNCQGPLETWATDDRARHIISNELGHGRKNVTAAYLGPAVRYKKPKET